MRQYKTVDCKGCGGPVRTSLKKPYCSHECRQKHKPKLSTIVDKQCCVCGVKVSKIVYPSRDYGSFCCSSDCQRVYAGRCGKDWIARSREAKDRASRESTNARKQTSCFAAWWKKSKASASDLKQDVDVSAWEAKYQTAAQTLKQRVDLNSNGHARRKGMTWGKLCEKQQESNYSNLGGWEKKCYSTYKNMKWKRRLRNAKKNILMRIVDAEPQQKQLSIWEWLEIQPEHN